MYQTIDFQKAFDKVPHKRLISKIEAHGIGGKIITWLRGRRQRVVINGNVSSWADVLSGVLQGSILVPLFFVIFINDIYKRLNCRLLKFADDTNIYLGRSAVLKKLIKLGKI